jgi:hypothetical protein
MTASMVHVHQSSGTVASPYHCGDGAAEGRWVLLHKAQVLYQWCGFSLHSVGLHALTPLHSRASGLVTTTSEWSAVRARLSSAGGASSQHTPAEGCTAVTPGAGV